jgi:hypothetical protein
MNLYPVSDASPSWPPTPAEPNTTLLLNPFDVDPVQHLRFTPDGAIEPRDNSAMAKATIATCGLDRIALTYRRRKLAMRVHRLAQGLVMRLNETPPNNAEIKNLAERLVEVGDATEILAGMVRAIVYEYLDVPWQKIEALANQ